MRVWCRLAVPALAAMVLTAGPAPGDQAPDGFVTRALIAQQLVRNDPHYAERRDERLDRVTPLAAQLHELQERGRSLPCSAQILNETRWLLKATDNWSTVDRNIFVLGTTLLDPDQGFALDQQPHDGSWGTCYDAWFKKLDPTVNALNHLAVVDLKPSYPLRFLAPIATADDLVAMLDRLRVNDVAATGVDQRDELGAVAAFAAELAFKRPLGDLVRQTTPEMRLDPAYAADLERFLDDWQDPETGYWGAWYRIDGKLLKATDLSFTYHVIAYRDGNVGNWDRILATTLAIRTGEYPYGWRFKGEDNTHNAYDIVRILELGWPHLAPDAQARWRGVISDLVRTVMATTLRPDGSFAPVAGFDSSFADAQYYGVSLLVKSGYCSAKPPFWTETRPRAAPATCCRIADRLARADQRAKAIGAAERRLAKSGIDCTTPAATAADAEDASARPDWFGEDW